MCFHWKECEVDKYKQPRFLSERLGTPFGTEKPRSCMMHEKKELQQTIELLKKEIQTLREGLIMFQKTNVKSKIHQVKTK
jgi:hypothetical protein